MLGSFSIITAVHLQIILDEPVEQFAGPVSAKV